MKRVTESDLRFAAMQLAAALNVPFDTFNTAGSILLSGAYGGWQLQKYTGEHGGIIALTSGYIPKRELHSIICGMIAGAKMRAAAAGSGSTQ